MGVATDKKTDPNTRELLQGSLYNVSPSSRICWGRCPPTCAVGRVQDTGKKRYTSSRVMLPKATVLSCGKATIEWQPGAPCIRVIEPLAVQRIVRTLLENTVRYSAGAGTGASVTLRLQEAETTVIIEILDVARTFPPSSASAYSSPSCALKNHAACTPAAPAWAPPLSARSPSLTSRISACMAGRAVTP